MPRKRTKKKLPPPPRSVLLVDATRCTGCRACVVACAQWYEWEPSGGFGYHYFEGWGPNVLIKMTDHEATTVDGVSWMLAPVFCMHCFYAPCLAVCPVPGAIERDPRSGYTIVLNESRCIDCLYCTYVCAFNLLVPADNGEGRYLVSKCNRCIERVRNRELPACVTACPTGALLFGEVKEVTKEMSSRLAAVRRTGKGERIDYGKGYLGGLGIRYIFDSGDSRDYFLVGQPFYTRAAWTWQSILKTLALVAGGAAFAFMILHRAVIGPLGVKIVEEEEELEPTPEEIERMIQMKRREGQMKALGAEKRLMRRIKKRKRPGRPRRPRRRT